MSLFTNPQTQMLRATGMPVLSPNHKDIGLNYSISAFGIGAPTSYQITFQQPRSPIAEGIFTFHDDLILFLIGILGFVLIIILSIISIGKKGSNNTKIFSSIRVIHEAKLEIIWTCLPALFLVIIAIPSFSLLYSVDEIVEPWLIFKVIGHQWYWSYEFLTPKLFSKLYSDIKANDSIDFSIEDNSSFDSYRLSLDDMPKKLTYINKLIVDNHLYLPTKVQLRAIITSTDVLHCWAVPSLGIKLDACPGRLNQIGLFINNQGFYYGQCSEICGVNHGFIPVGIVGVNFYIINNQNNIDFDPLLSFFYDQQERVKPVAVATGLTFWGLTTSVSATILAVAPFFAVVGLSYGFLRYRTKPAKVTPYVEFDVDTARAGDTNYTVVEPDTAREIHEIIQQVGETLKAAGSSAEEQERVIHYLTDHLSPTGADGQLVIWQRPFNIKEVIVKCDIEEDRFKTVLEAALQKMADWYFVRIPGTNGRLTKFHVDDFSTVFKTYLEKKENFSSTIEKLMPFVKAISKKASPEEHSLAVRNLVNSTVTIDKKHINVNMDLVNEAVAQLWTQLG